jgi:SAM-dependent methyltransferase
MKKRLVAKIQEQQLYTAICDCLPPNDSRPHNLTTFLKNVVDCLTSPVRVLDLGCGEGNSTDLFESLDKEIVWHGVDIEDSPEVRNRRKQSDSILTFDGVNLPYATDYFDLIYTNQVLEHVRYPDALMADMFRVVKHGGILIGSVSYLEPYHSYSIFNFTPHGIREVIIGSGFDLVEIRPEADAMKLLLRQLFNRSQHWKLIWNHNYLYTLIELVGMLFRLGHRERNFLKIQFSGHLLFLAAKPDNNTEGDG